jgi:hypothetical protein
VSTCPCRKARWHKAGLIVDANGNLFGTTYDAGTNDFGTVFAVMSNAFATTATTDVPEPMTPACWAFA